MILYFSATGNCAHVARRIADATGDRALSIEGLDPHVELADGEALGFVTPTYAYGLPANVADFLRALEAEAPSRPYSFLVATFGTSPGQVYRLAQRIVAGKSFAPLDAGLCVRMPDTWTPTYDLSDTGAVARMNEEAEPQIDAAIARVVARERGDFVHPKTPRIAIPLTRAFYEDMRRTSHFRLDDTCVGCRLCAKRCPAHAIEMQDGRPAWTAERCVMCLRCLHSCPKFAIQYGDRTRNHGQYRHP